MENHNGNSWHLSFNRNSKGHKDMEEERQPKLTGYCVLDSKGRITIPYKERKGVTGYLVYKHKDMMILVDPRFVGKG